MCNDPVFAPQHWTPTVHQYFVCVCARTTSWQSALKYDFIHFHVGNSSPGVGSEEDFSNSSHDDARDIDTVSPVASPDCPAAASVSNSESDEDTIARECYRIFKEYEPQESQRTVSKVKIKCHDEL
jgi:hypothetical protein